MRRKSAKRQRKLSCVQRMRQNTGRQRRVSNSDLSLLHVRQITDACEQRLRHAVANLVELRSEVERHVLFGHEKELRLTMTREDQQHAHKRLRVEIDDDLKAGRRHGPNIRWLPKDLPNLQMYDVRACRFLSSHCSSFGATMATGYRALVGPSI